MSIFYKGRIKIINNLGNWAKKGKNIKPIGKLINKKQVWCEICGSQYTRKTKEFIYHHTQEEIDKAKAKLLKKASKKYTCRICKIIQKESRYGN